MLGPIGSEIMRIFRLLSPDEIDRYIVDDKVGRIEGNMAAGGESIAFDDGHPQSNQYSKNKDKLSEEHKAEIIPFSEHQEKKAAQQYLDESERLSEDTAGDSDRDRSLAAQEKAQRVVASANDLSSIGVLSGSSIRQIEKDRLEKENKKKDSATVFLIKERQKMRESKQKLSEQTALKLYQTNASQEFHEQSEDDLLDEDSPNDLRGILINKKQY